MANMHTEYENMITAIAAYLCVIETDIEADASSNEKHDPEHITGGWVLDALNADDDAMDEIASRVKQHVLKLREQAARVSASVKYQRASMILGEAFYDNWRAMVAAGQFKGSLKEFASQELDGNFGEELWPELDAIQSHD